MFSSSIGIANSAIGLKICGIAAEIKKTIFKKNESKHDQIELLSKSKLTSIEVLISLIDSNIIRDESVLIKEYDDLKEKIK